MQSDTQHKQTQSSNNAAWEFVMRPLQNNLYFKGEIKIDLTPLNK